MASNPAQLTSARFYELLWPCRADVLRMARVICGNDTEAEDLAQETLLRAAAEIDRLPEAGGALMLAVRMLRATRADRLSASNAPENEEDESPEDLQDWQQPGVLLEAFTQKELIDGMQSVPEELRWALLLVDVQQREPQDAAELLNVPVDTLKHYSRRGKAALRRALLPKAKRLNKERKP